MDLIYRWINPLNGIAKRELVLRFDAGLTLGRMNSLQRFRDNTELKYSLRSVARHAAWVRTIHIIGEGPPPDWLAVEPPIVWIDHDRFLSANGQSASLNSETQKLYFSKVPGLAERFICFDDDWFLGRDVAKEDFFTADGRPIHPSTIEFHGGHAPLAWTKACFDQGLRLLPPELVAIVAGGGTRRLDPFQMMRARLQDTGQIVRSTERDAKVWLREVNVQNYPVVLRVILKGRPPAFCLNDDWSTDDDEYGVQMSVLAAFFSAMYPDAAPWEIPPYEPERER